jgi:hypothetical protein
MAREKPVNLVLNSYSRNDNPMFDKDFICTPMNTLWLVSHNLAGVRMGRNPERGVSENAQTTPADRACSVPKQSMVSCSESDHPGYSFERTPWVLVTGMGPFVEIEVRRGEPYQAASSTRPVKRRAVLGTWPGLESQAPRAGAILAQVADHFADIGKMVLSEAIP